MMKANDFVQMFGNNEPQQNINLRFAKVAPNYISGRPSLIFDGETTPTVKTYLFLSSYQPKPDERVMVLNNIILGKIGDVYEG